jgi:hypothetical protein
LTLEEYISEYENNLKKFENLEQYEYCKELYDFINCLKEKDVKTYMDFSFDIKGLTKAGFLKKGFTQDQIEERIKTFFDIESIFDYSLIGGSSMCFLKRTLKKMEYGCE